MITLLATIALLMHKQPTRPLYPLRTICVKDVYVSGADTTSRISCYAVREDMRKA